jgi:hypothetical protein
LIEDLHSLHNMSTIVDILGGFARVNQLSIAYFSNRKQSVTAKKNLLACQLLKH